MSAERGGSLFGGRISVPWGSKCPFTREHGVGAAQFTQLVTWFPRNDVTASKVRWLTSLTLARRDRRRPRQQLAARVKTPPGKTASIQNGPGSVKMSLTLFTDYTITAH